MKMAMDNFIDAFNNKNVIIFVPHEDDEIGLAGNLIYLLSKAKVNTYIVFMTNGDYETSAKRRIKEAISGLKVLGIRKENIIFLGYCDCLNGNDKHIFYAYEENPITSYAGRRETYSIANKPEWCFVKLGIHHPYTRSNLMSDITSVLLEIKPDYIFSIDCDYHSDHRALSIIVEEAIGKLLETNFSYRPQVFKGFAYSTGYKSKADYKCINLDRTLRPNIEGQFELGNPVYLWEERLRVPVEKKCRTKLRYLNVLYRALRKHKSQYASRFFSRIANSDEVFWRRRTDSLTYQAKVEVSSGNGQLLKDFKYFDSADIMKPKGYKLDVSKGVWYPDKDDIDKQVVFFLKKQVPFVRFPYMKIQSQLRILNYAN